MNLAHLHTLIGKIIRETPEFAALEVVTEDDDKVVGFMMFSSDIDNGSISIVVNEDRLDDGVISWRP